MCNSFFPQANKTAKLIVTSIVIFPFCSFSGFSQFGPNVL